MRMRHDLATMTAPFWLVTFVRGPEGLMREEPVPVRTLEMLIGPVS